MQLTLPFGTGSTWKLEASNTTQLGPAMANREQGLSDPVEAIRHALGNPLNFPPFASATVSGDVAVVPIQPGTPCAGQLAFGTVKALIDAGVEPANITILLADESTWQVVRATLAGKELDDVRVEQHDPSDEQGCAFLGLTATSRPLRLNRTLCQADLVIPIGTTSAEWEKSLPKFAGLFPDFSDQETLRRFHAPIGRDSAVHQSGHREEIEEAGWLLGAGAVVQVVPATEGRVACLFAGEPGAVAAAASEKHLSIWAPTVNRRGDLAIALLAGEETDQSWKNIGHALHAADAVLDDSGAVVLCTDLHEPPGRSLQRLGAADALEARPQEIMRDREADSWTALQLARALERGPVYLHSQLESPVVEAMGITPIHSADELSRLLQQHAHCVILDSAHRLAPRSVENVVP